MIDLIAVKDFILDKLEDLSEVIDLEDRVSSAKKTLVRAKKDLGKKVYALKQKNLGDILDALFPKKTDCAKKTNPFVAVFCVLGGIVLAFVALVAVFYGIFYLLDSKKKNGYHTLKF